MAVAVAGAVAVAATRLTLAAATLPATLWNIYIYRLAHDVSGEKMSLFVGPLLSRPNKLKFIQMSAIVKKVVAEVTGKYVFDKVAALGPRNPLYEEYTDDSGNAQTKKREIPLGLSKKDQATLAKIRKRAYRLDKGFNLCGLQFGYTFIFGLIPGFGDVLVGSEIFECVERVFCCTAHPAQRTHHLSLYDVITHTSTYRTLSLTTF